MSNHKAIILAAGRGSRMNELTLNRPKCLLEVNGISLLNRQISALKRAGIEEIGVVTGYQHELLEQRGLVTFHNADWSSTNMVASLCCAQEWLECNPCIVSYSDIFYQSEAVAQLLSCKSALALTYDENWESLWEQRFEDPLSDAETFCFDTYSNLVDIGQKTSNIERIQGQYMGLFVIRPQGWKEAQAVIQSLPKVEFQRFYMTDLFQAIVDRGKEKVKVLPYSDVWGEVDSPSDLMLYQAEQA
ncbi:nucleotidyl transferase [Oleiphilus messinensis]|uniref:Nucleotidyl transferase n=1 Tax=Oleiphilus messinensis TaxID=141451 RepID=A0A1Y0I9H6_9GAMM|nr:phosphocholine cytidylyltransferase family protein [Oleiphilus messinensis]ARU57168.1 nucleotidyl transferase [Oleiphilus messinensis]